MELNEYQEKAKTTMIYGSKNKVIYPILGLCGEAGEVSEKIKKVIRDDDGKISPSKKEELKKELGDTLWYLSALATDLELSLDDIAKTNLDKLFSRKERGKLQGSGDNR